MTARADLARADIALGSNLGDRAAWLARARGALSLLPGTRLIGASAIEETAPFGPVAQGPYLNQMIAVQSVLGPHALLEAIQDIERRLGRVRRERWGARTIDLDIVRHGDHRMETTRLTLPHPGLPARDFWRRELRELDRLVGRAS
jgi:2-amino-4-hydroxy-6-hydroxymethyldihydropteridine diphosphokinase